SATIANSTIRDNAAGNTLDNSKAQAGGVGGGIRALGPLEVNDSTIAGNRAVSIDHGPSSGGGISAAGPVALVRRPVRDDAVGPSAMSLLGTPGIAGGLAVENATLVNSTISGNPGGGIVAGGTLELSNATITENVGSGVIAGSLVLRNTIVAGNSPADCVVASTTGDAYTTDRR